MAHISSSTSFHFFDSRMLESYGSQGGFRSIMTFSSAELISSSFPATKEIKFLNQMRPFCFLKSFNWVQFLKRNLLWP